MQKTEERKRKDECKTFDKTFEQNYPEKAKTLFPIRYLANKLLLLLLFRQKLIKEQKYKERKKNSNNLYISVTSDLTDFQRHLLDAKAIKIAPTKDRTRNTTEKFKMSKK